MTRTRDESNPPRPSPGRGRALVAEPLLQLLGVMVVAALLGSAVRGTRANPAPSAPGVGGADPMRIVIAPAEVEARVAREQAASGRAVSGARRVAVVEQVVRDEVLVREARRLGLDRSDEVVRRRLVQMMELLLATAEPADPPGEAELAAYLAAHPERFARPARVALTQVFVGRASHPEDGERVARELLERLTGGADPAGLGDPFPRGASFPPRAAPELDAIFGPLFGERVIALPVGRWSGPVASSYGLHLVRIDESLEPVLPPLAEVRREVARALGEERAAGAAQRAYEELAARYVVERPAGEGAGP